jgi:hypothetical protein
MEEMSRVCKIGVEGKIIKINLKETCGGEWIHLAQGRHGKHGNKPSSSIKGGKFLG